MKIGRKDTIEIPNVDHQPEVREVSAKIERLQARRQEIDAEIERARRLGIEAAMPGGSTAAGDREHGDEWRRARDQRKQAMVDAYLERGAAALVDEPEIDVESLLREREILQDAMPKVERELATARAEAKRRLSAQLDPRRREIIDRVGAAQDELLAARRELFEFEHAVEQAGCKPARWHFAGISAGQSIGELSEAVERWHRVRRGVQPGDQDFNPARGALPPEFGSDLG